MQTATSLESRCGLWHVTTAVARARVLLRQLAVVLVRPTGRSRIFSSRSVTSESIRRVSYLLYNLTRHTNHYDDSPRLLNHVHVRSVIHVLNGKQRPAHLIADQLRVDRWIHRPRSQQDSSV